MTLKDPLEIPMLTMTAMIKTIPKNPSCQLTSTPNKTIPFLISPVIKTPKAVPNTVPTPPNKEAPQMTQAAITANSIPLPFNGATEPNRKA